MKGSHQPYAIFIILLAVLIALACIPVTDSAHTLPVLQGKAVWPNSQKTNTSIIYNLDGEWKLLFESDSESWQHVPEVAWNRGYGIYRMELYVEEASTPFELYTVNAGTNYELWINSELTGTSGTYGTSADSFRFYYFWSFMYVRIHAFCACSLYEKSHLFSWICTRGSSCRMWWYIKKPVRNICPFS